MRTQPLPLRKSLGTDYNLRPDTERVQAHTLRAGDVVMEDHDHPVTIVRIGRPGGGVAVHGLYIWQSPLERPWLMGTFTKTHPFDRATPDEY